MDDTVRLIIKNSLSELTRANEEVRKFLTPRALEQKVSYLIHLTMEEFLTNIIKYSYDDTNSHDIVVEITFAKDLATLRFEDDGHPFDPLSAPVPDIKMPLEQRRTGGLGIYLIRTMAKDVRYDRIDGKNVVTITVDTKKS